MGAGGEGRKEGGGRGGGGDRGDTGAAGVWRRERTHMTGGAWNAGAPSPVQPSALGPPGSRGTVKLGPSKQTQNVSSRTREKEKLPFASHFGEVAGPHPWSLTWLNGAPPDAAIKTSVTGVPIVAQRERI